MNASSLTLRLKTQDELPYEWRYSPWVLNVRDECIRDIAVAIMHQAIIDAGKIREGKPLERAEYAIDTREDDRLDFLDWLESIHFVRVCDSINDGKDMWGTDSMRRKVQEILG